MKRVNLPHVLAVDSLNMAGELRRNMGTGYRFRATRLLTIRHCIDESRRYRAMRSIHAPFWEER